VSVPSIRRRRKALDWTQEALARRARVSISMLRLLDRGIEPKRSAAGDRVRRVLEREEAKRNGASS
jgi:predicted transcriptional regulator